MTAESRYELLGTRSITIGIGDKNSSMIRLKESLPCCRHVVRMLIRICWVFAPFSVRLPPQVFRATTAGRKARSAALFVASMPGQ